MASRTFITGYGLVTPLGHSSWETFAALLAGRTLADRAAELPADIAPVDLVRALGSVSFAQHSPTDPAVELAERAAREAITMAGLRDADLRDLPAVIATSKGAVHALTAAADRHAALSSGRTVTALTAPPRLIDPHLAVALGPHGYLTHHLRRRLQLGDVTHLVAACASSLIALHRARLALLRDDCEPADPCHSPRRILIITADAALLPAFIHAYHRLGVLAPLTPHDYRGLPLDERAQGFMIAQAGAAVLLERINDDAWPLPSHAVELLDSAEGCDAFDLIRPCESMPALRRIAGDLLSGREVDLIHPHATGTERHDHHELAALHEAGQAQSADLYAHKGALGHTLGCSGLISTVIACLCARTGRRPPMPWIRSPLAPQVCADPPRRDIRTQAVFAAGFAGHAAGVVLRSS